MYEDISIKLNPYLGRSKNLMEIFAIIGYEEKILQKFSPNIIENQQNFNLSIISNIISDLSYLSDFDFKIDDIIPKIYPQKPEIIKINKNSQRPPNSTNVLFYLCNDSKNDKNKIINSGYALRYYEKYLDLSSGINYYVPKALLILSQYPYFTTYKNICQNILQLKNDKNNIIPIEIFIYYLINYTPSPINNKLNINIFKNQPNIIIKRLTGYPYSDFDLFKIINIIPFKEFIKIFIFTFLEIKLLFFSPNLEKLNLFMFIFNILNYPLIDSPYHWNINSISLKDLNSFKDQTSLFLGVNSCFNNNYNFSNFSNPFYIVDIENKILKNIYMDHNNNELEELNKLLTYIEKIVLNKNNINSYFLQDYINILKNKLEQIKILYNKNINNSNENDSFLYINENIYIINIKIQKIFYDFILNIMMLFYKDLKFDSNNNELKTNYYDNKKFSDEEKIFLKYFRNNYKYNSYFNQFLKNFKVLDELKISYLFTDEYIHLKYNDLENNIVDKISYFQLMYNLYSSNNKIVTIDINDFEKKFKKDKIKKFYKNNNSQLFNLNKDNLKIFFFYKKNSNIYDNLNKKEKEKEEIKFDKIDKTSLVISIQNNENIKNILDNEFYIRSSIVYVFSIIFPLLPHNKNIKFLKKIINFNILKLKFFHRYYIYILLKSIHKYYMINKENNIFPELTLENVKLYCNLIKKFFLLRNTIIPNEEILLFFKKIFSNDNIDIKDNNNSNNNIINVKDNENNIDNIINDKDEPNNNEPKFIFEYLKEEDYIKKIPSKIIKKNNKILIFKYKGIEEKYELLKNNEFFLIYDYYINILNFNIINFKNDNLIEFIINVLYNYLKLKDEDMACTLLNIIIILKKLKNDLNNYENDINNKINENNFINNNIDNNDDDSKLINNIIDTSSKERNNSISKNNININSDIDDDLDNIICL